MIIITRDEVNREERCNMFEVYVYLGVAYLVVIPLIRVLKGRSRRQRPAHWHWVAIIALLATPILPYIRVELQTLLFRQSVAPMIGPALEQTGDIPRVRMLKVLSVTPTEMHVYVVTPCRDSNQYLGEVYHFERVDGKWRFSPPEDTVFADCGNADGNVFPPYAASGDFGGSR